VFDEVYILFHFNIILKHNGVSSTKINIASQARYVSQYTNVNRKVMKCCANIYFNRQCLKQTLTPNYSKIKIPNTSPASRFTKQKIVKLRIKDEIKFLYLKKGVFDEVCIFFILILHSCSASQ